MQKKRLTIAEINALDQEGFVAMLGSLFEGPPWIVHDAWHYRPFTDAAELHQILCALMYQAPIEQQIALLRAHPDLVGRAALAGTLSPASTGEQAAAGLNHLSPEEIASFQHYNTEYRAKFDFPFVICARENKKESILQGFATRIHNKQEQEISTALDEVAKICYFRLQDILVEEGA